MHIVNTTQHLPIKDITPMTYAQNRWSWLGIFFRPKGGSAFFKNISNSKHSPLILQFFYTCYVKHFELIELLNPCKLIFQIFV